MTTPDYDAAAARFRDVFAKLAPGASVRERKREHPFEEVRELTDAGFGKLRVPPEYGGFGVSLPTLFEWLAEAGRADSNITQILRGHFSAVEIFRYTLPSPQAEYWLRTIADGAVFGNAQSEEASNAPNFLPSTRLLEVDGRKVVSGTKFYSTGSLFADYIRVGVAHDEDRASFAVVPARDPHVVHADDWDGFGQRLTGSGTTYFDNVPVVENGLLAPYAGYLRPYLASFNQLVHIANLAGIARNAADDTVALIKSRKRTHTYALSDEATADPEVLAVAGHVYRHSRTIDAILAQVSATLDAADRAGAAGDEAAMDAYHRALIEVSAAQVSAIELALQATTLVFNAGGASAVREGTGLDRHWRNARVLSSHNPVIYKPHVIGNYLVNGQRPIFMDDKRRQQREAAAHGASEVHASEVV